VIRYEEISTSVPITFLIHKRTLALSFVHPIRKAIGEKGYWAELATVKGDFGRAPTEYRVRLGQDIFILENLTTPDMEFAKKFYEQLVAVHKLKETDPNPDKVLAVVLEAKL